MHRKKMLSKKWGLITQPFTMNYIKIVTLFKLSTSYSIMAEGVGSVVESENGLFPTKSLVACRERLVELQCLLGNRFV